MPVRNPVLQVEIELPLPLLPRSATYTATLAPPLYRLPGTALIRLYYLLVLSGLCCAGVSAAHAQIVRDSGGVRIVVAPEPANRVALAQPALIIGQVEGDPEYLLDRVTGAVRFANGSVAVASQSTYNVRFYDHTGRYLSAFGREGDGPKEFRVVSSLLRCGLTALALAKDKGIGYRLDERGRYLGDVRIRPEGWRNDVPKTVLCDAGWSMVAIGWGVFSRNLPIGPHREQRVPVALMDSGGGRVVRVGEFAGEERYRHERSDGPHPVGKRLVAAASPAGVVLGTGDAPELSFYDRTGKLTQILRWRASNVTFTNADRRAFVESQMSRRPSDAGLRRFYEDLQYPRTLPPYAAIFVDSKQRLWVEAYPNPGRAQTSYLVFTLAGRPIARVTVPRILRTFMIDDDHIVAGRTDELGVEYVEIYRISQLPG